MQLRRVAVAVAAFLILSVTEAHNITNILDKNPEFSTFNHYLTVTQLAPEINNRRTITVCVVDNAGMADLLAKHLTLGGIKNVLSLHVLLDYFDDRKLHQITDGSALAATMYQATGTATGSSGFVNITELKGGKVGFSPEDNNGTISATFVKPVLSEPYNISVIQISKIIPSSEAEAPAPAPSKENITGIMSAHGCKVFAETLAANPAQETYEDNLIGGLSIFCPGDDAMKAFLPRFKNLTAEGKQSLLEFHAMPIYQSLQSLRTNNGLTNTLATDGAKKYDFTVQNDGTEVTLVTSLVTAKIVSTLFDKQSLAIYQLNKVLLPEELFRPAASPAPAPSPDSDASPPKPSKSRHKSPPAPSDLSDSPADSPDGDTADEDSNSVGTVNFSGGLLGAVFLCVLSFLQL